TTNPFSFLNYGTIAGQPQDANDSTTTIAISGASSSELTTLSGGIFDQGRISAIAFSATGANAANTSATALLVNNFAVVKLIDVAGTSGISTISASVSGSEGGSANTVVFAAAANNGDVATNPTRIYCLTGCTIAALATTTSPSI